MFHKRRAGLSATAGLCLFTDYVSNILPVCHANKIRRLFAIAFHYVPKWTKNCPKIIHPLLPKLYRLNWHVARVPKLDCTEVVHPSVPKWSCTDLVLLRNNRRNTGIQDIGIFTRFTSQDIVSQKRVTYNHPAIHLPN